jgi:hypothetical protein
MGDGMLIVIWGSLWTTDFGARQITGLLLQALFGFIMSGLYVQYDSYQIFSAY